MVNVPIATAVIILSLLWFPRLLISLGPKTGERNLRRLLRNLNDLDPNLIDVFLVIIAALIISVAQSPAQQLMQEDYTLIKNPGAENMEIMIKQGETLEHYKASGDIGEGQGAKAGVAYRLQDGSMIYVPE